MSDLVHLRYPVQTTGERPSFSPLVELGNDPANGTNGGRLRGGRECCPTCGWRSAMDGVLMRLLGGLHGRQPRWPRRLMAWDWCPECQTWWPSQQRLARGVEAR
jgi:hypothetical protein